MEYSVDNPSIPLSAYKGGSHMPTVGSTPVFTPDEANARLRHAVHAKAVNFHAMYSSVLGGIVTDPAFMVLPLDDHMVHLSLIHISEPTRLLSISYAVFCLKK